MDFIKKVLLFVEKLRLLILVSQSFIMKMNKFNIFLSIFIIIFTQMLFSVELDTKIVEYGTTTQKINFIQNVLKEGNRAYLPYIANLLDDKDEIIREKAAETLWKIGDLTCVDYYKKGIEDSYWLVRYYCTRGLINFATGQELFIFYQLLDDPYWQVRYYAASGIGKYGNYESVDVLVDHINDTNEKVKEEILWALTKLMWRPESREKFKTLPDSKVENIFNLLKGNNIFLKIRTIWLIESTLDKRGIPYLISALDDENDEDKIKSVWALEELKAEEGIDEIEGLLSEQSTKVKIESIKTIVRLKSEEGLEGIIKGLNDTDESVRIYSLWALEKFKNASTYSEIVKCLDDNSQSVREYAIKIIEDIKDPIFIPILENFTDNNNYSIDSRLSALSLLGKIGDESVKTYFIDKMGSQDPLIRYGAIKGFSYLDMFDKQYLRVLSYLEKNDSSSRVRTESKKILKDIVNELILKIKSPVLTDRQFVIERVDEIIQSDESRNLIYKMLLSDYPDVRSKGVEVVAKRPEGLFAKGVKESLEEPDIEIRKIAAIAIGEIGDKSAIPILKKGLKHFDQEFQLNCAWALAKMGDKQAFSYAVDFINNPNPQFQKRAAEIFGFLKDRRCVGLLLQKLEEGELEVKLASSYALAKMGEIKGVEFLVRISEENIEPLRSQANVYLQDISIPSSLRAKVPQIRESIYQERLGIQEVKEKVIFAYKIAGTIINLDGKDDDRYWQMVEKNDKFIRIEGERVPYDIQTKVAVGYDEKNLYFLIICQEQGVKEINLNSRDFITISINPFNSKMQWYQFVFHPLGLIKYSYIWKFYKDDEKEREWQSSWIAVSSVESNRWIAEISIPLSELGIDKIENGDRWAINFLREIDKKSTSTWTGRIDIPEQFGILIFKEQL